ncbi:hypothetical protein [Streptomyces pristinaespiralis]|nr:hypothetical protein [Streptomyces pristinaespiralis]
MSTNKQDREEITTMGDHHAPVPPAYTTITTMVDHHAPVPPADGITTMGDHHAPVSLVDSSIFFHGRPPLSRVRRRSDTRSQTRRGTAAAARRGSRRGRGMSPGGR